MSELDKVSPKFPVIRLGGQDRELCYGFKFFADLIREHGTIEAGIRKFSEMGETGLNPDVLFDMVFKGMYHDESVTMDLVRTWMNKEINSMGKMRSLLEKVRMALEASTKDDSADPLDPVME